MSIRAEKDGPVTTTLSSTEMFGVPKGVEHEPFAENEVKLPLIEPRGMRNTGEAGGDRTAQNDVWIFELRADYLRHGAGARAIANLHPVAPSGTGFRPPARCEEDLSPTEHVARRQ